MAAAGTVFRRSCAKPAKLFLSRCLVLQIPKFAQRLGRATATCSLCEASTSSMPVFEVIDGRASSKRKVMKSYGKDEAWWQSKAKWTRGGC